MNCPCNSNKKYGDCCEPIIQQKAAATAQKLMRSRYTAYKTGQANYLYETTHPSVRKSYSLKQIEQWSKENNWTKLEIVSVEHGSIRDTRGIVEFKAYYTDYNGNEQVHHEKSTFLKEGNTWFYVEGVINPKEVDLMKKTSRNDPCPCGSGKKYKKCCA